jgi:outer membrane protein assembly factor BamD
MNLQDIKVHKPRFSSGFLAAIPADMKHLLKIYLVTTLLLLTAACSSDEDEAAELAKSLETQPVETLYNDAMELIQSQDYKSAKKAFEEVERQHPYSQWAKRAQVMNAYANYKIQSYDEALVILDRFVRLYPGDERTPYAYYLIALCSYEQITDVGRDQSMTAGALDALQEVIRRYPDSDYARDATIKRDLTVDHLAGKEMEVGRYYMKRKEYAAAAKRFTKVIDEYQTTSHTPEALHRMVEVYLKMGVTVEAQKYAAVLGENFPNSPWYKGSYALLKPHDSKKDSSKKEGWLSGVL